MLNVLSITKRKIYAFVYGRERGGDMGYKERERDREKGEQREKGIEGELTERERDGLQREGER